MAIEVTSLDFNKKLLIIGCGGHSKVVTDIAESLGFANISFLDTFSDKDIFYKLDWKLINSFNIIRSSNYEKVFSIIFDFICTCILL